MYIVSYCILYTKHIPEKSPILAVLLSISKGHGRCPFNYIHELALNEVEWDRLLHSSPPRPG